MIRKMSPLKQNDSNIVARELQLSLWLKYVNKCFSQLFSMKPLKNALHWTKNSENGIINIEMVNIVDLICLHTEIYSGRENNDVGDERHLFCFNLICVVQSDLMIHLNKRSA